MILTIVVCAILVMAAFAVGFYMGRHKATHIHLKESIHSLKEHITKHMNSDFPLSGGE